MLFYKNSEKVDFKFMFLVKKHYRDYRKEVVFSDTEHGTCA
jgi:hypothetical protein